MSYWFWVLLAVWIGGVLALWSECVQVLKAMLRVMKKAADWVAN